MHISNTRSQKATANAAFPCRLSPPADPWSFFDKVYCISLTTRIDRRAEAQRQFARIGLAEKVEFVLVDKHPANCEQGIYESHLLCMTKGLAHQAQTILIFEDDVIFDRFARQRLAQAVQFLKIYPGWQVFFLGCMVSKSTPIRHTPVVQINYRSLTHAYAVRREFADTLIQRHPWQGVAYDDFFKNLHSNHMYAIYPSFAFQSNSPSDNDPYLPLDRFRRLCGGLSAIQKRNELYHRYKWWVISGHALFLLMLAALLYQ